jgi:taspase (threonine aspartase 1)
MSVHHHIIAAHGGAGYHPPASDSSLKRSLCAAISSALPAFSGGTTRSDTTRSGGSSSESSSSALDATTAIIVALEDHPDFNAGYGSNLTFDGQVECDASLMLSTEEEPFSFSFGSVGAVRGVRNPVLLARCVLEGRRRRERGKGGGLGGPMGMGMGRVPPLMLVGEGAVKFARERGVRVVDALEEMVAPTARQEWRVWRERCSRWEDKEYDDRDDGDFGSEDLPPRGAQEEEAGKGEPLRVRLDTVGAVVLVGEAGDIGQRSEVGAGVSRCVMSSAFRFGFPSAGVLAGAFCSSTPDAWARSVRRRNRLCLVFEMNTPN